MIYKFLYPQNKQIISWCSQTNFACEIYIEHSEWPDYKMSYVHNVYIYVSTRIHQI